MIFKTAQYFVLFMVSSFFAWCIAMYISFGNEFFETIWQDWINFSKAAVYTFVLFLFISILFAKRHKNKESLPHIQEQSTQ